MIPAKQKSRIITRSSYHVQIYHGKKNAIAVLTAIVL